MKKKIVFTLVWLAIWEATARIINNEILLVGPIGTVKSLIGLLQLPTFYLSVLNSVLRITGGFVLSLLAGLVLSYISYRIHIIEDLFSPVVSVMKSIPVASFVIILLIWAGNENLALFVVGIVTFPIIYINMLNGLKSSDDKMIEMARIFRMKEIDKLKYVYFPSAVPSLKSAVSLSIGMAYKSGVAAEVIGQPLMSMGNGMYRSKIFLETGDLFAWTLVVILISFLFEKLFLLLTSAVSGNKHDDEIGKDTK